MVHRKDLELSQHNNVVRSYTVIHFMRIQPTRKNTYRCLYSYGPLPVVSTDNPIYRMYNLVKKKKQI